MLDVSVIIPAHDRLELLLDSLRSIREPAGVSWEAIVVDDGSDEPIEEATSRLGLEHLTYVRQSRAGAPAARNRGLALARGRLIKFLDSDDELEPGALTRQVEGIDRHACDVVYSDWRFTGNLQDPRVGGTPLRIAAPDRPILISLLDGWWCANFSYLYRSDVARRATWDERLRRWQDFDYVVQIAATGARFERVPGVVGSYRIHGHGQLTDRDQSKYLESRKLVLDKLVAWVEQLPPGSPDCTAARRAVAQLHWDTTEILYSLGLDAEGEVLLRRAERLSEGFTPRGDLAIHGLVRVVGPINAQRLIRLRRRAGSWLKRRLGR